MKKIFTLVVAVVFAASSFAQVSLQNMNGKVKTNNFKGIEKSVKSSEEGWISMAAYLEGYWGEGSVENGSGNYLQIDSLGLAQFGDEYSHPWFFSVSQIYDFTSSFWTDASVEGELSLTETESFDIDSISISGFYFRGDRYPANTKDTLVVGVRTDLIESEVPVYSFSAYENTCFYYLPYDAANGVAEGAQIFKFPIDESYISEPADEEGSFYLSSFDFPLNLTNVTGKAWHISYTFKRGYDIAMNDTLDYYSQAEFFTWKSPDPNYSISANNPEICANLSHGQFNNAFTNGVVDYYYPDFAYSSPFHYPRMFVKVACNDCKYVAVEEMEKENLTVYPNPAHNYFKVELAGDSKANIQLFNLVGQQVYSETASNVATINTSNLKAGIYMLKVSQDGKVYTSKVVVK